MTAGPGAKAEVDASRQTDGSQTEETSGSGDIVRAQRSTHTISRQSIGDEPSSRDTLGFEPYVNAMSDFLMASFTPEATSSATWGDMVQPLF